jgi:hypothetical protein
MPTLRCSVVEGPTYFRGLGGWFESKKALCELSKGVAWVIGNVLRGTGDELFGNLAYPMITVQIETAI